MLRLGITIALTGAMLTALGGYQAGQPFGLYFLTGLFVWGVVGTVVVGVVQLVKWLRA